MLTHGEMILRIASGAALGGVIGYERDVHHRPVGLRTHLIVAMASATFMVISTQFVYWQHFAKDDLVEVDASRIAASVVSGIGFLAGGAILRTGVSIQGLTTAAALWLVTAIGMCTGSGMFVEGVVVTALGILALTVLRRFEDKHVQRRQITVVLGPQAVGIEDVLSAIRRAGGAAVEVEYERHLDEPKKKLVAKIDVECHDEATLPKLLRAVEAVPDIRRVHVRHHG